MKLYRFSPIQSSEACKKALEYIDLKLRELSRLTISENLPVNTLKIFAHYPDEYQFLRSWVTTLGNAEPQNSPTSYYVRPASSMVVNLDPIEYVGIRVPDPYRGQVGCGDFVVSNFKKFKSKYGTSQFVRPVAHQKYDMLELFHPEIDVLGYIVREY